MELWWSAHFLESFAGWNTAQPPGMNFGVFD
jgi:hypothetical protein